MIPFESAFQDEASEAGRAGHRQGRQPLCNDLITQSNTALCSSCKMESAITKEVFGHIHLRTSTFAEEDPLCYTELSPW